MVEGYPHGLRGWGVPAIFKEAGRLMWKYGALLAPFVFAFLLPTALVQLAEIFGLAWWATGQDPFLPPGPHPHPHRHHAVLYASSKSLVEVDPSTPTGRALLVMLALGIILWLLASLAAASIAKTVEYIYDSEEDPAVIKSIFKSLPQALFRLFMTSLWIFLLTLATFFTVSIPFYVLTRLFHHSALFATLQQVFLSVFLTILGFLFLLSQQVAVLEPENYGLSALQKSSQLVHEKLLASLVLFLVSIGVGALLSRLSNAARHFPGKLPPWTFYLFAVLLAVLYLAYMVYMLLVTIVLYFSSKSHFDADDDDSLPEFRRGDNPYLPLIVPAEA